MINPRQLAFEALMKTDRDGAFSNLALDALLSKSGLDIRDKSFVSALFYGVMERQLTIDYNLSLYLSKSPKKLKPQALTALRLGAFQILYMDKVPDSAAVNESVKLAKKNGAAYAASLINAVLRKLCQKGLSLPEKDNEPEFLSIKYSCPKWLVEKWIEEYGSENTLCLLESSLGSADTFIRVNTLKTDCDSLISMLADEGITAEKTTVENALKINLSGNSVENCAVFQKGLFHVQDLASQLCAAAVDPQPGETVLDLCSAPGGKAFTMAERMNNSGRLLCFDLYEHRVSLIRQGAERLGISVITADCGNAENYDPTLPVADRVLCDVPCSGLGIIRRKPEIKYKNPEDLAGLPEIQLKILLNASHYVKAGGRLVYSTCTLSKAENEAVCEKFLSLSEEFDYERIFPGDAGHRTFMPHTDHSDGFFAACFKRKG